MATKPTFALTFKGFLAVRLMEFDYCGKHFSYHGRKLENAINRLAAKGGPFPKKGREGTAEMVVWGQASHDWRVENAGQKRG
jgi:hypothetical protein